MFILFRQGDGMVHIAGSNEWHERHHLLVLDKQVRFLGFAEQDLGPLGTLTPACWASTVASWPIRSLWTTSLFLSSPAGVKAALVNCSICLRSSRKALC